MLGFWEGFILATDQILPANLNIHSDGFWEGFILATDQILPFAYHQFITFTCVGDELLWESRPRFGAQGQ